MAKSKQWDEEAVYRVLREELTESQARTISRRLTQRLGDGDTGGDGGFPPAEPMTNDAESKMGSTLAGTDEESRESQRAAEMGRPQPK